MYRRSGGASSVSSASDPMLAEYISATERRGRALGVASVDCTTVTAAKWRG